MAWDFETDPEYQKKLDWVDQFVREEVEPLDLAFPHLQFVPLEGKRREAIDPLKEEVRRQGLWATHLGPELGGQGYGQLKLALLNEILGRSQWAPIVFGCQAPDTGNAEIIAHYGTDEQKERYLQPLLSGECFSSYSMTEPHAGADPTLFTTRAEKDGDEWVINGWKYFSSNAKTASFLIVMAVTNTEVSPYKGMSMFLVPTDTPGVNIVRNVGLYGEPVNEGSHALIHYEDVRVPEESLLGGEGQAFVIAQTRLGGGRIHHAMRTIGMAQKAIDMMCERALSRETAGSKLADKQFVQGYIADSYAQLIQFRIFVLYTAWEIDKYNDYKRVRKDIATAKVVMPTVLHDIAWRAMQVHGALGTTNEMPFFGMIHGAGVMGLADGPTEVHKVTVARQVLRDYKESDDIWPTQWLPKRQEAARAKYARVSGTGGREPVSTTEEAADAPTIADVAKLTAWLDAQGLGVGAPLEHGYISGGSQNEIYELRRGDFHCAMRIPPRECAGLARRRHRAGMAHHRGADRHQRPAHRGRRRVHRPVGPGPHLLPDGLRGRLVTHVDATPMAGALRHRHGRAARTRLPTRRGHCVAGQRRLAGQGPRGPRPPRRVPRAPGRSLDRLLGAHQGTRAAGVRRGVRVAAGPRPDRLHPGTHARRLPVRQRHVQARCTGTTRRHRRLGDGYRGRSQTRPGLGHELLARGHFGGRGPCGWVRGHEGHALARRNAVALRRACRDARSTTSTTTTSWPSGSWLSCSSRVTSAPETTRSCRRSVRSCST